MNENVKLLLWTAGIIAVVGIVGVVALTYGA